MTITTDPRHPDLTHGSDTSPIDQAKVYLALSDEEIAKGMTRPYRDSYIHRTCGTLTKMPDACAATYSREPKFYGSTYCCHCRMHRPVAEFDWLDGEVVGS